MPSQFLSDSELVARLSAHPDIKARLHSLLSAIDNETGELTEANAAEFRLIEEMRDLGKASLSAWAKQQMERASERIQQAHQATKDGKKNCAGTPPLEPSA